MFDGPALLKVLAAQTITAGATGNVTLVSQQRSMPWLVQNVQGTVGTVATVGRWDEKSGLILSSTIKWAGDRTAAPAGSRGVNLAVMMTGANDKVGKELRWIAEAAFRHVNQNTTLFTGNSETAPSQVMLVLLCVYPTEILCGLQALS